MPAPPGWRHREFRLSQGMVRIPVATVLGLLGLIAYLMAVVTLFDCVSPMNGWLQIVYFLVMGTAWVIPARWLMYWAAGQR